MNDDKQRHHYLFLIARRSTTLRREAARRVREAGRAVLAQYSDVAIEVLASPEEAESIYRLGLFSAYLKGAMSRQTFERLDEEQRKVLAQWNVRFSRSYRDKAADRTLAGTSWGAPGVSAPMPYSALDPRDFRKLLAERRKDLPPALARLVARDVGKPRNRKKPRRVARPLDGEKFSAYERQLAEIYKDKTFAYHLARLGQHLDAEYRKAFLKLPDWLVDLILALFFAESSCWKMSGEMAVGIVFVESSREGGPTFGNNERAEICQEIHDGLNWLASEHPAGDLSWVYDVQQVSIDVANQGDDSDEDYWRNPAMEKVSYSGHTYQAEWDAVAAYREDMRLANGSAHAITIFVTPFGNSWHAYAGGGRITLAKRNNWGGWGQGGLDVIAAHEMSHLFGAADEYTGSGSPCSSCDTIHGCDNIPNGNCGACAHPRQPCMMDANAHRICQYTRGQIGWADLFVETVTANEVFAGTDDDVWLDIGDRSFALDVSDVNDREVDSHDGYAIWVGGIDRSEIRRSLIRKSPDGFAGGWKLARFRLWHQGDVLCDQSPNQWLDTDHPTWAGCATDPDIVNTLAVTVSTANAIWAGTDDDVTLTLAGRSWNLDNRSSDDFEAGHSDTFNLDPGTGLRVSALHSIAISKSPDGIAGGWKLKGVKVVVNGTTIYDNQGIDSWLEGNHRTWSDSF